MNRLLQNWVCSQAQRRPDMLALVMREESMTYAELEESTNRLARLLKDAGCKRGDRVCFVIPKSPTAIMAILGILKADCIHVPIDISNPPERVAKILRSCEPRYILGTSGTLMLLNELFTYADLRASVGVGWTERSSPAGASFAPVFTWGDLQGYSGEPVACANRPDDPAHILFTSGSTGEPKGVIITHSNVSHFIEWAIKYFGIVCTDHISCHPPLHFDLATFDVFGAFAMGAQLHLVPPDLGVLPNKLADFIRSSELTQWFSVPSVLTYMARFDIVRPNDFPTLKRILWCGEVCPTPTLIYWMRRLPSVSFTNLYGPTEATIASSYYTVPSCPSDKAAAIPIGTACEGERLLVLDRNLQPVAPREVGDLYIGGVGLSPGYWRDPEKTAAVFILDGSDGRERMYKTGDLARVGDDGLTYFVGRTDSQIKCRGYRIELGEIEAALNTIADLKASAVVAIPTGGFEGNLICCAYVAGNTTGLPAVQMKLATLLPSYMLPSRWIPLEQLPANANGKIDRRKLRELFALENTSPILRQSYPASTL